MKKVLFVYPANREQLLKDVKNGVSPDNALYGLNYLSQYGYEATTKDAPPHLEKLLDIIFLPLHKIFFSQIDIDFKLGRAILLLPSLNKSDVIIVNTDGIGLAVCFLKRLKLVKKPVIYAVGLFYIKGKLKEAIEKNRKSVFGYSYKWILKGADQILYHAPIEKKKLAKLGVYNPALCSFAPIGSDGNFFKSSKFSKFKTLENTVVSVGKDRARDYKTLFEIAGKLPDVSFIIVARPNNLRDLKIPGNVTIHFDLPYEEVAKLYKLAKIVVIPIEEMHRSSGQMTLTDCLQASKPIIISSVEGISHYPLENNVNVILVPPQNQEILKDSIIKLLSDEGLQKTLIEGTEALAKRYNTRNYAKEIAKVITFLLDDFKISPLAEEDLEFARNIRNQNKDFFLTSMEITRDGQKKWFQAYSKNINDFMFILSKGSKKIGVGAIYDIDERKKVAQIGRFVIDSNYRGLGYGEILLEKIEYIAANRFGLKKLYLQVLEDNRKAVKLYKEGKFLKKKNITVNGKKVISMVKNLDPQNW